MKTESEQIKDRIALLNRKESALESDRDNLVSEIDRLEDMLDEINQGLEEINDELSRHEGEGYDI